VSAAWEIGPPAALERGFFRRPVLEVARDLIGCVVAHGPCCGVIVETEAYHQSEPACHAHSGLTPRTRVLFGEPGRAYVYRSYGIHALLNAVCEPEGVGAAVLIRALEPVCGLEAMRARRPSARERELCAGPGRLTRALGIGLDHNGGDLTGGGPVTFLGRPPGWQDVEILTDVRIGITRAAELPWRFCAAGSRHLSRRVGAPGSRRRARLTAAPPGTADGRRAGHG